MAASKPPFRAEDKFGLYRKVMKGKYDRIPKWYSSDLRKIIAWMLTVNTLKRPTIQQLLASRSIQAQLKKPSSPKVIEQINQPLLKTLKCPKDLKVRSFLTPGAPNLTYRLRI